MAKPIYHSSIEGAQHGGKGLDGFLKFAKEAGAAGAQPSNYMLEEDGSDGSKFRSASDIKDAFEKNGLKLDGVSGHCAFWVHTSAWTGTKSGHAFIHGQNQNKSPEELEQWYEDYLLRLMDLCAELGIKILPMFWGVSHGWELATGYPWGFWTSRTVATSTRKAMTVREQDRQDSRPRQQPRHLSGPRDSPRHGRHVC